MVVLLLLVSFVSLGCCIFFIRVAASAFPEQFNAFIFSDSYVTGKPKSVVTAANDIAKLERKLDELVNSQKEEMRNDFLINNALLYTYAADGYFYRFDFSAWEPAGYNYWLHVCGFTESEDCGTNQAKNFALDTVLLYQDEVVETMIVDKLSNVFFDNKDLFLLRLVTNKRSIEILFYPINKDTGSALYKAYPKETVRDTSYNLSITSDTIEGFSLQVVADASGVITENASYKFYLDGVGKVQVSSPY